MSEVSREYVALKNLLDAWNCSELFDHFQAEDINIEELQIMKFHHIELALQLFRLGTRIRFEHHLQQWRQSLHKPLRVTQMNTCASHCPCKCSAQTLPDSLDIPANSTDMQHSNYNAPMSRSITPYELPPEPLVAVTEIESEAVLLENNSNDDNLLQPIKEDTVLSDKPKVTLNVKEKTSQEKHVPKRSKQESLVTKTPVTVKHILKNCGPKGIELFNFRIQNEPLSKAQRTLLIHLIVSYFADNKMHLSLHISHMLEREILKIFSREKLSLYRTEKRGKMYIKFSNLKRYSKNSKAPKPENIRQRNVSINESNCQIICDEPTVSLENWEEVSLLESQIKIEDCYNATC